MTINFPKNFITKLLIAFALLSTITLILGCSSGKPDDMSEQHYKYAIQVIEITDAYLDYELTADEAYDKLSELINRENELPDSKLGDPNYSREHTVEFYTRSLHYDIMSADHKNIMNMSSVETYGSIVESRNKIAESIGMKKR